MSIVYQCAGCQKRFKVADTSAGKRVKCKECGAIGTVPAAAAMAHASVPPPPPGRVPGTMPPPPPPPPPKREEEDDDIFSAMADLERTGTSNDDGQYNIAAPPPPPPGKSTGGGTSYTSMTASAATPASGGGYVAPVAAPWVPSQLSFLDFNKPFHRIVLMGCFGILVLGGLALAVWGFGKAGKDAKFNSSAKQVMARLSGRAERNDIYRRRRADIEAYDIQYKFTVNGKEYKGEEDQVRADDFPPDVDPRQSFDQQEAHLEVYYDPENPSNNRVELPSTLFDWILVAVGVVAMPVGGFGGWRVWRYDRYARTIGS